MTYTALGKEVLRNGEHFADAVDTGAARLIADVLNGRGTVRVQGIPVAGQCRAYQCSDQMLCGCGLAWDVNDSDPPPCPATP